MSASHPTPRVVAFIPARYESTRFPAKMVADLAGKPLVLHAHDRAAKATLVDEVVIAADDQRIADALAPYNARVIMTDPKHPSGTDRIAEAVAQVDADIVVNVQGDEVMVEPEVIDAVIKPLRRQSEVVMSTARHLIQDPQDIANPNVVKVVCDINGHAIYFTRCPIPYVRDPEDDAPPCHWQHIGLYAYRRDFLLRYAALPQTPLERLEKLEQLRVLEHGYTIAVVDTTYESIGVDTPEDFERARKMLEDSPHL